MINQSVLIVSNSIGGGGAENSMRELHVNLRKKLPCTLLALNNDEFSSGAQDGIVVLNRKWGGGIFSTVITFFMLNLEISRIKPAALIVNCELAELLIAFSPLGKIKIFCVEHTTNPWNGRRMLGFVVRRALSLKNCVWVTVSSNETKIWQVRGPIQHVPNPVREITLSNQNRPPRAVYVGRLNLGKRPDWAVCAAAEARIGLSVFGDGPLLNELIGLGISLSSDVKFHGYLENCWDYVSEDDVLLMPSAFEGDGIVVVQAILAGMRILLADNLDLRRFDLPDECYVKNEQEMASKLAELDFTNREMYRAGRHLIQRLQKERSVESISNRWIKLLTDH